MNNLDDSTCVVGLYMASLSNKRFILMQQGTTLMNETDMFFYMYIYM